MKNKLLLIIIFSIGFLLRVVFINKVPTALNWDEVSHGYNAYSILNTSKDEWGNKMPLIFRAYGDYKLPLYIYTSIPFIYLFGLNSFSIRLVSVLAGSFCILITYFLVKEIFFNFKEKNKIAIMAALFVAIEPWSFFLSRGAFEANFAMFQFITAVTLFFVFLNSRKYLYFYFSSLFFGLTLWTYNSYRIFTLMFLFFVFLIYRKNVFLNIKKFIYSILIFSLFLIPMVIQMLFGAGQERYKLVAVLNEGAVNTIINNRNNSNLPYIVTKLVYNRPVYFVSHFVKNYASFFSPNFLFIKGGNHYQFNVPYYGLIHLVNAPFLILGLLYVVKNFKQKNFQLLIIWIILYPIAASVTRESPHTLRGITILPLPMILTSYGLLISFNFIKQIRFRNLSDKVYVLLYFFILIISSVVYFNFYFKDYKTYYSWAWQFGYKEAVVYVKENYDNYDYILISKVYGEPHEFILFYWIWDPQKYLNDSNLNRFYQSSWYWVDSFDKFYFLNDWNINIDSLATKKFNLESGETIDCSGKRCLLVTKPDIWFSSWKIKKVINYPSNEEAAFLIYDNL